MSSWGREAASLPRAATKSALGGFKAKRRRGVGDVYEGEEESVERESEHCRRVFDGR